VSRFAAAQDQQAGDHAGARGALASSAGQPQRADQIRDLAASGRVVESLVQREVTMTNPPGRAKATDLTIKWLCSRFTLAR
jgi:hypothetical protein